MTFTRGSSYQGIQFQSGFLVIDKKNSKKFDNYSELTEVEKVAVLLKELQEDPRTLSSTNLPKSETL